MHTKTISTETSKFNIKIRHQYTKPSAATLQELQASTNLVSINSTEKCWGQNQYFKDQLPGTSESMWTRSSVYTRLQVASQHLPKDYGLYLFDAWRSIDTQAFLYQDFTKQLSETQPNWSSDEIAAEAKKFVSHPTDTKTCPVPFHVSGGAIDLCIYHIPSKQPCFFGAGFDELSERSQTDFYEQDYTPAAGVTKEQWIIARDNRRLLFNLMKEQGFTNLRSEWWHFDLGTCEYARIMALDWYYSRITP